MRQGPQKKALKRTSQTGTLVEVLILSLYRPGEQPNRGDNPAVTVQSKQMNKSQPNCDSTNLS